MSILRREGDLDLLRFTTAGSVDDGKSTLIGRLLYDAHALYDDHIEALRKMAGGDAASLDFSLITDGLKAEREQGITIDVAYRYFCDAHVGGSSSPIRPDTSSTREIWRPELRLRMSRSS